MTKRDPNRERTELHIRLGVEETRKREIASVIAAFRRGLTIDGTAPLLGVSVRTLKRLLESDEGLRTAWLEEKAKRRANR